MVGDRRFPELLTGLSGRFSQLPVRSRKLLRTHNHLDFAFLDALVSPASAALGGGNLLVLSSASLVARSSVAWHVTQ